MIKTNTRLIVTFVDVHGYPTGAIESDCILFRGESSPIVKFKNSLMEKVLNTNSLRFYEDNHYNFICDDIESLHKDHPNGPSQIDIEVLDFDNKYIILSPGLWKNGRRICDDTSLYFITLMMSDSAFIPSNRSTFNDEFFFLYERYVKRQNIIQNRVLHDDIFDQDNISVHTLNNVCYRKSKHVPSVKTCKKAKYIIIKTDM